MSRFNPAQFQGTDRFGGGGIANPNKPSLPTGVFGRDRGSGITGGRPKTNQRQSSVNTSSTERLLSE